MFTFETEEWRPAPDFTTEPGNGANCRQYDPTFSARDPKFDREFDQNKEFYNPIAPHGAPRLSAASPPRPH